MLLLNRRSLATVIILAALVGGQFSSVNAPTLPATESFPTDDSGSAVPTRGRPAALTVGDAPCGSTCEPTDHEKADVEVAEMVVESVLVVVEVQNEVLNEIAKVHRRIFRKILGW